MEMKPVRKNCGMNRWAKFSLVMLFTMLVSMFMGGGWYGPKQAAAAIETLQNFTNVYHAAAYPGTFSYTVGAGTERVLVVAIASNKNATGAQTGPTSVTYGGQAMTYVIGDAAVSARQHTYLYYMKDTPSVMDGTARDIVITGMAGTTTVINDVYAAVFQNVDQTTTIRDSKNYCVSAAGTPAAFATGLTVNTDDQAVMVWNSPDSTTTTAPTVTMPANWTNVASQTWATTLGVRTIAGTRAVPVTNTVDTASTTISTNGRMAMSALSLIMSTTPQGGPTVQWTTTAQSSAAESGTMTVTAQLSETVASTVTVPFTVSGTATSGNDFTITASPITITAGNLTGSATITITADSTPEPDETVILTMGTPTNAGRGVNTVHTATIVTDDGTGGLVAVATDWAVIGTGTVATFPTMTLAKGTGTNRLLLVQVVGDYSTAATTFQPTVTYGGQTLTRIVSTDTTSRQKIWMGYLKEAGIAAATGTPPAFAVTWGTAPTTGCGLAAAFYNGVDQSATTITASRSVASDTAATTPTSGTIAVNQGGYAVYGSNVNTALASTPPAGYTEAMDTANGTLYEHAAGSKAITVTGTENPLPTWGSNRYAFLAAALNRAVSTDSEKPVITQFTAPSSSTSQTISPITLTATDDTGVTGYLINESATPPSASLVNLATPPTSYTVATGGNKTLYAWARDAAGNVSLVYAGQSCVVTLPSPPVRAANWTSQYGAVAYPAGTVSNYTVPAGSNRLLVVAIASTSTAVGAQSVTNVTWGGKPLTLAAGTGSLATIWNHSYLYYLKEADIASATGNALTVTITGGTAYYTRIYAAVYTGVDQSNPVPSAANYESNQTATTAVGPFAPTLTVNGYEQAVEIVNLARSAISTTARTISTWATGWTTAGQAPTGITTNGPTQQVYIRDRAVPATTVNDGSEHVASSASSYKSMTAMTIKPGAAGLTVTTGSIIANKSVYAGDTYVAVDAFNMMAPAAETVTNIQITGSASCTNTNVTAFRIYRKVGSNATIWEDGDLEIGSGDFSGGTVVNVTVSESVSTAKNYIIVFDIAATAAPSTVNTLTAYVSAVTGNSPASVSDPVASSAIVTIHPTTTIGDGASEPAALRLYKGSAGTNLDAFTLSHNSAQTSDNDTISTVTVTLSPPEISGSGSVLSKISEVAVVSSDGNTVYGASTAAATGDIWNIPTPGLIATVNPATYYVRIKTAASIVPGFYTVGGKITAVVHSRGLNKLDNNDNNSQIHAIDIENPNNPASFTATTTDPAIQPGGKIDLAWTAAAVLDPNLGTLDLTTPYIVKRSIAGGVDPAEYCSDGANVPIINGQFTFRDSGLNDISAPIYHYRICAKDQQGNISVGITSSAASAYTNHCFETPVVSLGTPDPLNPLLIQDQLVKSEGGNPFPLTISSRNVGDCPNTTFNIALVETSTTGGSCTKCDATDPPPSLDDFIVTYPASLLLGKTAGPGGTNKTSGTVDITVNARPYADQIQRYIFKAQVTAAGITTVTTDQATAILNDMPPIVHNANNMGKYQYGTWGNTYTCATCHSNSTTNIKGIYQIISTPIGNRKVVFTKISSTSSDYTGVYSNDQRSNKNGSDQVCSVCHHQTRQHQYSASKPFGGPNNDSPYNPDHHNSRDCVRCHTHNSAFKSIYSVCGDCHGFKGTDYAPINAATMAKPPTNALGPVPPSYGAHMPHNYAEMTCAVCHSNTNHAMNTDTWFGDTKLEIGFQIDNTTYPRFNPATPVTGGSFEGANNLNDPYTWVAGPGTTITPVVDYNASCTTYCHGNWSGNVGSNTKPNWVGTGQASCGTCHNATTITPPVSGSHLTHSGTGATGVGIQCIKCHGSYTLAQYTSSNHVNGKVEWSLAAAYPGATYNNHSSGSTNALAPTDPADYSTCSNLYCHSNVQGDGGFGPPTFYGTPKWGDNGAESQTAACGDCHIYPNTVGGHAQHENETFAVVCQVCHNNGGRTTPQNHANGKIDFNFMGYGANTVYSKGNLVTPGISGYGTCSSSNCHGRYTRTWAPASPITICDKCHGSATSARGFYNTRGPDGALSIYSAAIGVHDIHLQNPNSPRKATFSRFTSYAKGMSCKQCHYDPTGPYSPGHIDTALPAEVPFAHVSSVAHNGDAFGYYSSPSYASQTCSSVWCHGAGMASNTSRDKYIGTTPRVSPAKPQWNVPFLTGNSTTDCVKCHALPPPAPNDTYTHYKKSASREYLVTECNECHKHMNTDGKSFNDKSLHINGKIDGGCNGCHGNPPTTTGSGGTDPNGLANPLQNALRLGTAGAHAKHLANVKISSQGECYNCHFEYSSAMPSNNLEIGFNGYGGKVKSGTFTGYTNTVNGPKWLANSAPGGTTTITKVNGSGGAQTANVCSNLYCHGSTIPGGTQQSPNWEGGDADAACGTCHGGDPSNVPFPAQTGAHTRHASSSVGGLALSCETCHGLSVVNLTHVDANVQWELNQNNQKIGTTARYRNLSTGSTGNLAPSVSYGNCTNFYCHSNVQGANGVGAPTSYQTVTWGGSALTCSSCHSAMSSGAATGSHVGHAQTSGYACSTCHHDGGEDKETHADGLIFVNMTSTAGGTYSNNGRDAGSAAGYGTCSATACHGTVSPTWGTSSGKPKCEICHGFRKSPWNAFNGATANTDSKVGAHFNHISSNSVAPKISSPISCLACHSDSISQSTDAISAAGHMNNAGSNKVNIAGGGTYASGTCSSVYCHGATLSGTRANPVWNVPMLTGVASNDCVKCHGYPPATTTHNGKLPADCKTCHTHTNAAGTGFDDPTLHINGIVEGGDCISCHSEVKGVRAAAAGQFASQSHHVQGSELPLTAVHCYKCHWEANSDGSINATYHGKTSTAGVSLVVWDGATRPVTVTGTTYISYTANGTRSQIAKLNQHCLSCHNSTPKTGANLFGFYATDQYSPEAKLSTPKAKTSILSRYSSTRTVPWSIYNYSSASGGVARFGTNQKNRTTKALSAHGKASKNQMPAWSASANGPGEDGNMTDYTYSGNSGKRDVLCYDCHNSHGSKASGITSSYSSATGKYKGGLLKTTQAGIGGYFVNYSPATRTINYKNYSTTATTAATFNSGASICNDCHVNGNPKNSTVTKPWNVLTTYSTIGGRSISGYWSTPYFDNYTVNSAKRTTYKAGYTNANNNKTMTKPMGGHYGSSVSVAMGGSAAHSGEINGLCTPCHDPHGVSNALGADRDHGVPLLKGTWVTSPYREDKADKLVKRGGGSSGWGGLANGGAVPGYHIDQNTFMRVPAPVNSGAATATAVSNKRSQRFRSFSLLSSAQTGTDMPNLAPATFAGLCLECHNQAALTGSSSNTTVQGWKTKERVHQSVSGWASTNGTNVSNKVHAYTCAKCHAPHVSRLPRLLVTNCLDVRHFGQRLNTTILSTATGSAAANAGNIVQSGLTSGKGSGRFPGGGSRYSVGNTGYPQNPGGWWFQTNGAAGTTPPTVVSTGYGSNCHNAAGAGGATWNPGNQMWNNKSRW